MLSESELLAQIAKFLKGELSLDALADWLASTSWNMHKHASPQLQQWVGLIELCLAEYSNGHRTEDDVRVLLQSIAVAPQPAGTTSALPVGIPTAHVTNVRGVFLSPLTSSNLITSLNPQAPAGQPRPHAWIEELIPA